MLGIEKLLFASYMTMEFHNIQASTKCLANTLLPDREEIS